MQDQLHAATVVKKSLEHEIFLRRHYAKHHLRAGEILNNLFGGRATIIGTLIGALIMGVLQNGLNLLAVSSFYQQMAIGTVLVLAVWLDQMNRTRRLR